MIDQLITDLKDAAGTADAEAAVKAILTDFVSDPAAAKHLCPMIPKMMSSLLKMTVFRSGSAGFSPAPACRRIITACQPPSVFSGG